MFDRKGSNTKKETSIEKSEIKAFLGPGSQFEGKLVFDEIVRLDGSFRGEITSTDTLIVGKTADLQADITVGTLILSGRLRGNIKARIRVELRAPAVVDGPIDTPILMVEEGVVINSTLTMKKEGASVAEEVVKKAVVLGQK